MKAGLFRRMVNLWPPLLFSGIKATYIRDDYREASVMLKLRWYNRNYVGVQYGGSLFSMTDPWYMLMLMNNLGRDYYIWDKGASIDYVAPGKGRVMAHFVITQEALDDIRQQTAQGEKYLPEFQVNIVDDQGALVARVRRIMYVRRKPRAR